MTQEQKELLMKDLSARLSYGLKLGFYASVTEQTYTCTLLGLEPQADEPVIAKTDNGSFYMLADHVKPYLFPMTSLSKEQKSHLYYNTKFDVDRYGDLVTKFDEDDNYLCTDLYDYLSIIDWLNKNHFDYRGLIPMGLALDATGLNIY